MGNPVAIIL